MTRRREQRADRRVAEAEALRSRRDELRQRVPQRQNTDSHTKKIYTLYSSLILVLSRGSCLSPSLVCLRKGSKIVVIVAEKVPRAELGSARLPLGRIALVLLARQYQLQSGR